ncbi:MAG: hypothetical protein F6K10_32790, partial [Moorea sp. SIO2B7]|nr:hypothetical protein [Moorena sp. SIO2B7]
ADISVDDDGMVGIVAIASTDNEKVAEARRQIELILDPPTAEVGAEYAGRVVNISQQQNHQLVNSNEQFGWPTMAAKMGQKQSLSD